MKEIGQAQFGDQKVTLYLTLFTHSKTPCVYGVCEDGIPWGRLTTFVEGLESDQVAVDTNNGAHLNYPQVLHKTRLFEYTNYVLGSGYCQYPVMKYVGEPLEEVLEL